MLETIRSYINNLDDRNFQEFYQDYIFDIQDNLIELEFKYLISHNMGLMSICNYEKLVNKEMQELMSISEEI